jgi:hypothetical protein
MIWQKVSNGIDDAFAGKSVDIFSYGCVLVIAVLLVCVAVIVRCSIARLE